MKKNRELLEEYLVKYFVTLLTDDLKKVNAIIYCKQKYEYPESRLLDFLTKRMTLSEGSDWDLFVVFDTIMSQIPTKNKLTTYFTETEINEYSSTKYKKPKKTGFPLKFKMIAIADDQWIGRITARELVLLRNAGVIRYNKNIQRTMRRGYRGRTEEYRITENKKSIREIKNSMQAGTFISNTITLNIPDDVESEFKYDEDSMILTITKAKSLDIIDGFHRLVALEQAANMDKKWDYPMELRISNYSEGKGQRFVYQEDQKTKMRKIDSDSFNVEDEAVKWVSRLNEDPACNLSGQINRNEGLISLAEMAAIVQKLHFQDLGKKAARVRSVELAKELREDFNTLTEFDTKYMTQRYAFADLYIILVAFIWLRERPEIKRENWGPIISRSIDNCDEELRKTIIRRVPSRPMTKRIVELIERS